ncbi:HAD family hydrolase [Bacteroidetes bacterium endosymbiont of Geopemphigus sp.]|uniref:HAD family hydrolase n=1 Tax=Bacteroidetes bacterium endosymbiont of Geopemphigus sp. TaxID=2047937 RepID=UPI000CD0D8D4|nr:HAD family phosphatase [Bacteroidetes bacterium endosymbiont of Geopemphigus sp.]
MIKNIIFDFGNVFISLRIFYTRVQFMKLGLFYVPKTLRDLFKKYETGQVSAEIFLLTIKKYSPLGDIEKIHKAWNTLIGNFDERALKILSWSAQSYRLFLLSNMNALHMEHIQKKMGPLYENFQTSFEKCYFSHEIQLRKPDRKAYEIILKQQNLKAQETLFVDDLKENIATAHTLGIHTKRFDLRDDKLFDLKKWMEDFL